MNTLRGKIVSAGCLAGRLAQLKHPIVFTNGCFDILHRGHVTYLEQARSLGQSMVVGVNSDESVRQLNKGPNRPLNTLADRMAVLAALTSVDLVVSFDQNTPMQLIKQVRPDHLVKGGDWSPDSIVGAELVRTYGGKVHSIPIEFRRSTTDLIDQIRAG